MLDSLIQFFTQWGYLGLFLGSFLAGSIVPFSSEALVIACVGPLHMTPVTSLFVALAGNVSGGMTCYYIGHLGKIEWIEKYARVSEEKLNRALHFMHNRGAWMGFFAFVPMLGTAISVALGYVYRLILQFKDACFTTVRGEYRLSGNLTLTPTDN